MSGFTIMGVILSDSTLRLAFRGAIGPHVAAIAVQYGIDVEDDLARVLPAADDDPKSA